MKQATLTVKDVSKKFGGIQAVNNISFEIDSGALGIIGPNGCGKTTLLNLINGIYRLDSGDIAFMGKRLNDLPSHERARLGIGRTFQVPKIFRNMTVTENLISALLAKDGSIDDMKARRLADQSLIHAGLTHMAEKQARELSGGQKKLLELVRTLISEPRLLLLDEPFAGVHPEIANRIVQILQDRNGTGVAVVLVSHETGIIFNVCDSVLVMSHGSKVVEGPPSTVREDPAVVQAYLGG